MAATRACMNACSAYCKGVAVAWQSFLSGHSGYGTCVIAVHLYSSTILHPCRHPHSEAMKSPPAAIQLIIVSPHLPQSPLLSALP